MNNDLISREALKEAIRRTWLPLNREWLIMTLDEIIDNAPTIPNEYMRGYEAAEREYKRPQGEWIPVSERLPEYSGLYLISIYDLVTVANFTGKYFCDRQMDKFVDVFAWQPLPEPYKKGGAV